MTTIYCCNTCGAGRQNSRLDTALKTARVRYQAFFGFPQRPYDPFSVPVQVPYAQSVYTAGTAFGARTPAEWDAVEHLLTGRYERRFWQAKLHQGFKIALRVCGRWQIRTLTPDARQRKQLFGVLARENLPITGDLAERVFVQSFTTLVQGQ